jgi:hypothetical protein
MSKLVKTIEALARRDPSQYVIGKTTSLWTSSVVVMIIMERLEK